MGAPGTGPSAGSDPSPPPAEPTVRVVDLDWRTGVTLTVLVLAALALVGVARSAPRAMTWISIGSLLALALDPVVDRMQRHTTRRASAVALVVGIFVVSVVGLSLLIGPPTARQADKFKDDIPKITSQLGDLPLVGQRLKDAGVPGKVERFLKDLPQRVGRDDAQVESTARSVLGGALAAFATLLVTVVLLLDGDRLIRGLRGVIPPGRRERADRFGRLCYVIVGRYFAGSLFVALLSGVAVLAIGLSLGVPLTPVLAVWVAVFNLVPQIGGAVGGVPFVLFGLTQGMGVGIACLVFFILWLNFENHILSPLIVGRSVNLSPPTTMLASLIGVSAAGVPGALVANPLVGALKAIYLELRPPVDQPPPASDQLEHPAEPTGPAALVARLRQRFARA